MKAIMYHYVRPFEQSFPLFKHLHIDDFKLQLDYFERKYGFVTKKEFFDSFNTGKIVDGVILTFDDGVSCHYDYVYKTLKERNLWGIFYIPTQPYSEDKMLDVHRIHLLLGKEDSEIIYKYLKNIINDDFLDTIKKDEFKQQTYMYQNNNEYTLLVKRILNYYILYEYREDIISKLIEKFIPDFHNIYQNFYIKPEQLREMTNNGMLLGSHSVNHLVMSRLTIKEQYEQIITSFNTLEQLADNLEVKTFCYPYGGFHSFTNETELILKNEGFLFSFNVEHRDIEKRDILIRPQALPRYDCNQFEYGECRI